MRVEARFYDFAKGTMRVVEREFDREEVSRNNALMQHIAQPQNRKRSGEARNLPKGPKR